MAVPFKKVLRKNPRNQSSEAKYYPQLVTLGQSTNLENIAYTMKEMSSLSLGDIQSVLTNFVEAMRTALYNGQSVNIKNFGVFSLGARTSGSETAKDCTVKNIKSVRINFRASTNVKPSLTATRAGERIEFLDIMGAVDGTASGSGEDNTNPGGGDGGDDWQDPDA